MRVVFFTARASKFIGEHQNDVIFVCSYPTRLNVRHTANRKHVFSSSFVAPIVTSSVEHRDQHQGISSQNLLLWTVKSIKMAMDAHLITNLFNHTLEPSPEVRAQAEKQLAQVCKNMCLCVYTCVLVHWLCMCSSLLVSLPKLKLHKYS